jgi:hypothetical protein
MLGATCEWAWVAGFELQASPQTTALLGALPKAQEQPLKVSNLTIPVMTLGLYVSAGKEDNKALSMISSLEQALASLPTAGTSADQVRRLAELVEGDLPLQGFLEQLLPQLCDIFSAPAAVVWMKVQGAVFGVRYRMEPFLPTTAHQKKHERLVQFAWFQKRPLMAEPSQMPLSGSDPQANMRGALGTIQYAPVRSSIEDRQLSSEFSSEADRSHQDAQNPTEHPLLFAPILHLSEPIAFMEIVLPAQSVPFTTTQKQIYLRALQLVAERVYGGLKRRMSMPAAQFAQAAKELSSLVGQIHSLQVQIQRTIEVRLAQFQGWSFESLAENQEFARLVHQILDSHGLRVVCPECGYPAILRCLRAGNAKHGVFVYDHYLESGRTFHGGPTTFPAIKVVGKPARRTAATPATED